jgi:hypothetical protein
MIIADYNRFGQIWTMPNKYVQFFLKRCALHYIPEAKFHKKMRTNMCTNNSQKHQKSARIIVYFNTIRADFYFSS